MDTNKLKVLSRIVELGSMGKAAEELNYTKSALTHLVKSLEKEFGFPILERDYSGARINSYGRELLPYISAVVRAEDALRKRASQIADNINLRLCIGSLVSISMYILPPILLEFSNVMPNVDVELKIGDYDDLLRWLDDGTCDLCISLQENTEGFTWIPLCSDPFFAAVPKGVRPNEDGVFPIRRFSEIPFLMPSVNAEQRLRDVLQANGIRSQLQVRSADNNALLSIVGNGVGGSILPALCLADHPDSVSVYKLDVDIRRTIGIVLRPGSLKRPEIKTLTDCILQQTKANGAEDIADKV
mgnify:FL=1